MAAAVFLVASRVEAQYRSGDCPRLDTYIVTADGPPRPTACLMDGSGQVRAAIVEQHGRARLVVFDESNRYNSANANLAGGSNVVELDSMQRPSSFEGLDPAARAQLERLLGPAISQHGSPATQALPRRPLEDGPHATSDTRVLARYEYDWRGRVRKKIGEEGIRQYVYDGDSNRVIAEYDETGSLIRTYTWAEDRLLSIASGGERYYAVADGLNSVVAIADSQGQVVNSYKYDAWGNYRLRGESLPHLNPYGFTGHRWEPNLGLYSANARYFDPGLGRFLTQDSFLGRPDNPVSLHRYLYAADNPLVFVDPEGNESVRQAWGLTDAQGFWSALGKNVAYNAWNVVSLGTLGRQDTLVERFEAGRITDEQYIHRTAINAGSSVAVAVASAVTGGTAGAMAGAMGANAVVAGAVAGAAAGVGGQAATDIVEVGLLGTKTAAEVRGSDYLMAGGMGALFGGASAHAAASAQAASPATKAVTVVESAPPPKTASVDAVVAAAGGYRVAGGSQAASLFERAASTPAVTSQDAFAGVRELSRSLQQAGASRAQRLDVIRSFREGTITGKTATGQEVFLRYFGGQAQAEGRFLTPSFPPTGGARTLLALPPENFATSMAQFRFEPGTRYFLGTVARNFGKPGGGVQIYVLDKGALVPVK